MRFEEQIISADKYQHVFAPNEGYCLYVLHHVHPDYKKSDNPSPREENKIL